MFVVWLMLFFEGCWFLVDREIKRRRIELIRRSPSEDVLAKERFRRSMAEAKWPVIKWAWYPLGIMLVVVGLVGMVASL